jgi:hypothetical protein
MIDVAHKDLTGQSCEWLLRENRELELANRVNRYLERTGS